MFCTPLVTEDALNQTTEYSPLSRAEHRVAERRQRELAQVGPLPVVDTPSGHVIFAALTARAIKCRGKVTPARFFPAFCQRLAEQGYASHFAFQPDELTRLAALRNAVIVHLYHEESIVPEDQQVRAAETLAVAVFNRPAIGRIIADKAATNKFLTSKGILMPSMTPDRGTPVFSNAATGSSKPAWVVSNLVELDRARYNTAFIDTTLALSGRDYLATLRLMVVGGTVVLSYIGLRPKDLQRPSVHGVTTPRDPSLYNHAYATLFLEREPELRDLAQRLNAALGPGFYHHDLLVERGSGRVYLCEVGYKFDPCAFSDHMATIGDQVPSLAPLYDGGFSRASADALLAEVRAG